MALRPGLLAAVLAVSAQASPAPLLTSASRADQAMKRAGSCTFTGSTGATAAIESQASCATIVLSDLAVPSGMTLDLSQLNDNTHVIFKGDTTWGYKEWDGPLLKISGKRITVEGAPGARLNGNGARWWDGQGSNGKRKPKFFFAHDLSSSTIKNLYIQDTPIQAVSVNGCNDLLITGMTIDNSAGDSGGGRNTDGFDISSSNGVTISGASVHNQDDCVAVSSGTDIIFKDGVCVGGHGLGIGSVGTSSDNTVKRVTFSRSTVSNSANGMRIKASSDKTGQVMGVTYTDITLDAISGYGIIIEQNYDNGDLRGEPTTGIPITGLTISDIAGSSAVKSSAFNIVIACGGGSCSNWKWSNVNVSGGKDYAKCTNVPSGVTCST